MQKFELIIFVPHNFFFIKKVKIKKKKKKKKVNIFLMIFKKKMNKFYFLYLLIFSNLLFTSFLLYQSVKKTNLVESSKMLRVAKKSKEYDEYSKYPKVVLIAPFRGEIKNFHQFVFKSFSTNKCFDMLIFTDNIDLKKVADYPNINIHYDPHMIQNLTKSLFKIYLKDEIKFEEEIKNQTLLFESEPHRINQLRPAFGRLYQNYIQSYDYWGWVDLDLIVKFFLSF